MAKADIVVDVVLKCPVGFIVEQLPTQIPIPSTIQLVLRLPAILSLTPFHLCGMDPSRQMGQRESTASVQASLRIVGYNREYRWPSEHAHTKLGGAVTKHV